MAMVTGLAVLTSACSGGGDGGSSDVKAGASADGSGSGGGAKVTDDGKRRQIAAGEDGAPTAGELVASSADEWAQKWQESGATGAAPDVSDVNFDNEVAVALFLGERPTGGWRVGSDVTVRIQGQFGAVVYEILGPGDGCSSTQAITHPYLALAVRAKNLRFESSERLVPCK
jgi:hypothetical protein